MSDAITQRGNAPTGNWSFTGASRQNTDHGRVWARVTQDGDFTVTIYRDPACTRAVAAGTRAGAGPIELAALNESGLTGACELMQPATGECELDVFYACDADLYARHTGLAALLTSGNFAGRPGFAGPCDSARRALDLLLALHIGPDFRPDSLAPLAEAATCYALYFVYDWLSTLPDDPAAALAARWRQAAMQALPAIRLQRGAEVLAPFAPNVKRG